MTGHARLGTGAAALVLAGALLAHTLDEEGLLPGVREAARVREFGERGAARPLLLLGCVALAAVAGTLVARLHRRRLLKPATLLALVVAGQATAFASFEVVARVAAGADVAESFFEPAFLTGVAVQVAIGAAFVTLLLLAATALRHALPSRPRLTTSAYRPTTTHHARPAPSRRPAGTLRGRAPPSPVS